MLYRYQPTFCKMHSTNTFLSYFEDDIVIGLASDLLIGMALILGPEKWISKWWSHGRL